MKNKNIQSWAENCQQGCTSILITGAKITKVGLKETRKTRCYFIVHSMNLVVFDFF